MVKRTKGQLEAFNIPLEIVNTKSSYKIELGKRIGVLIPMDTLEKKIDQNIYYFNKLKEVIQIEKYYSSKELAVFLAMPKSTFQLLMKWAIEKRYFESQGASVAIKYKLRN